MLFCLQSLEDHVHIVGKQNSIMELSAEEGETPQDIDMTTSERVSSITY